MEKGKDVGVGTGRGQNTTGSAKEVRDEEVSGRSGRNHVESRGTTVTSKIGDPREQNEQGNSGQ